jgi:poly(hydroxyalkanoate) depolymerase family esterase
MLKRPRSRSRTGRRKSTAATAVGLMTAVFGSTIKAMTTATALHTAPAAATKAGAPATRTQSKAVKPPAATAAARSRTSTTPARASFRTGLHDCAFGKRRYKIYTPASAANSSALLPLLIMLHGCGQTPDDFAKGTRMNALAEEFRMLVVYPEQTREAHSNRCWNWFRRGDQHRDTGEPALIASLTRELLNSHPADPSRVYVAGLSAGASAALVLANAYPDLFAAVGAHSGLPAGAARDQTSAILAMSHGNPGDRRSAAVPTIIFHGSDDKVVAPRNGRFIAIRALEPFPPLQGTDLTRQVQNGRSYVKTTYRVGKGRPYVEHWLVTGSGHAWSGGSRAGRFVDPSGPDASRAMVRFFLRHKAPLRRKTTLRPF